MSDFHEILFPADISYGSQGGPKFKTAVFAADSGFEARVADWKSTRAEYDVSESIKDQLQMDRLTAFFYARRGRAYGFRFKDWNDFEGDNLSLGFGDYATTAFQAVKRYESTGADGVQHVHDRPLKKLAWDSQVGMQVDSVFISQNINDTQNYAIDFNTGVVTLAQPMRGGLYAGLAPQTAIDFITLAEGGHATSYSQIGAPAYDVARGRAYLVASFNLGGAGGASGLRTVDVNSAAEVLQKSAAQMGVTPTNGDTGDISGIVAVSPVDGSVFVTTGSGGGKAIFKLDASLNAVAHWGKAKGVADTESTPAPGKPGCCSLDGARFLLIPTSGAVAFHSAETCERLGTILTSGSYAGGCPWKQAGFAVLSNAGVATGPVRLTVQPGDGGSYTALDFGGPTASGLWLMWDAATGGVLVGWRETAADTDMWCGLYHEADAGFRWKRKMPRMLGYLGSAPCPQPALAGQMAWVINATFFGSSLWLLDTATGELKSRRLADTSYGLGQVYDPARKVLLTVNPSAEARVYACDIAGAAYAPPEHLTLQHVEFHVPVRFDTDHLNPKHEFWNTQSWDQIPLIEVRDWNDVELD